MKRREFITLLGGAAAAWPLPLSAQQVGRTYRLGILNSNLRETHPAHATLFEELRRFGFVEGQNLTVDVRGYGLRNEQFREIAGELVKDLVDVILCGGPAAIRAAQQATTTVPILGLADDMVAAKLVHSLAKPSGNTTGVSILAAELDGKRQEILIDLLPGARRMAALADPQSTGFLQIQALKDAAKAHGVELHIHVIANPEMIIPAIEQAKVSNAAALNVMASPLLNAQRQAIIQRTAALRLPAIHQWPETAEQGGLIAYGPRFTEIHRLQMARQLAKLLRGARPADLPVEQPTLFELVINLKTAMGVGVTVPSTLLNRADKVIE